jgi:hypothetical protein
VLVVLLEAENVGVFENELLTGGPPSAKPNLILDKFRQSVATIMTKENGMNLFEKDMML